MPDTVSDLARRLAENAEAVCRHYLSNGRRAGGYWLAGDIQNSPGRSLYVRLRGPTAGRGAAGKWIDAATGERGDLLDLIAATQRLHGGNALDEARRFLGLVPMPAKPPCPAPAGSSEAARRLFAMSRPIAGTLAEAYLRGRGIHLQHHHKAALRFHPHCFYRPDNGSESPGRPAWPAMVAAVTNQDGGITGLQRTYLDPGLDPPGSGKAPVPTPRRAMGHLLGHAVRFGKACDTLAAGEGIETVLSLQSVLPTMPMAAALSAGHLAAFLPPSKLRRLYIASDRDRAGHGAADRLVARAKEAGIQAIVLAPTTGDFNDDLRQLGAHALSAALRVQLVPEDVDRFWWPPERGGRPG